MVTSLIPYSKDGWGLAEHGQEKWAGYNSRPYYSWLRIRQRGKMVTSPMPSKIQIQPFRWKIRIPDRPMLQTRAKSELKWPRSERNKIDGCLKNQLKTIKKQPQNTEHLILDQPDAATSRVDAAKSHPSTPNPTVVAKRRGARAAWAAATAKSRGRARAVARVATWLNLGRWFWNERSGLFAVFYIYDC